jgi:hypothetical protein
MGAPSFGLFKLPPELREKGYHHLDNGTIEAHISLSPNLRVTGLFDDLADFACRITWFRLSLDDIWLAVIHRDIILAQGYVLFFVAKS